MDRVPVFCGEDCIELANPSRVKRLQAAANVQVIRRHKDGKVVELQVRDHGDDSGKRARRGNPLRYSYDHETKENPRGVWTMKRLPTSARRIFRAVIDDCAA